MITRTEQYRPDQVAEAIAVMEDAGWAVRQIVSNSVNALADTWLVVFEREVSE